MSLSSDCIYCLSNKPESSCHGCSSGLYLTLNPKCPPDCVCQTECASLDVSNNKHKQNYHGELVGTLGWRELVRVANFEFRQLK